MPKFKMESVSQDEIVNGVRRPGISVAIPLDDAAKCDPITDMAIGYKKYRPEDPNEKKILEKKMKEKAFRAMRKKGDIDEHQLQDALDYLKNR